MTKKLNLTFFLSKFTWCFFLITLLACGGGTTGTGEYEGKSFSGSIEDQDGQAAVGFSISLLSTGDSSSTDSEGKFSFNSNPQSSEIELLIEGAEFNQIVRIVDLPKEAVQVLLELSINTESNLISLISVSFEPLADSDPGEEETLEDSDPVSPSPEDPTQVDNRKHRVSLLILYANTKPVEAARINVPRLGLDLFTDSSGEVGFKLPRDSSSFRVNFFVQNLGSGLTLRGLMTEKPLDITVEIILSINEDFFDNPNIPVAAEDKDFFVSRKKVKKTRRK